MQFIGKNELCHCFDKKDRWTAPLGGGNCRPKGARSWETHCSADNRIVQYAISATSSGPFQMSGYWGPEQATGMRFGIGSLR
ncbi:unnamed protein product [Anisakis simplex]|uniref:Pappalysin-1 SD scarf domain-containing protein n=1 Tax=Anisakis simplex TaxID=6269 RepID=A0A0M3JGC2_ANISI|nr:unnamed protein product [Anisakis simplex]